MDGCLRSEGCLRRDVEHLVEGLISHLSLPESLARSNGARDSLFPEPLLFNPEQVVTVCRSVLNHDRLDFYWP